jgi:uncharacterized protein YraI
LRYSNSWQNFESHFYLSINSYLIGFYSRTGLLWQTQTKPFLSVNRVKKSSLEFKNTIFYPDEFADYSRHIILDSDNLMNSFFSWRSANWGAGYSVVYLPFTMKPLDFMCASLNRKEHTSNIHFSPLAQRLRKISTSTWLHCLGLAIASIGIGVSANQAIAQVYYQRSVSVTGTGGTVSTRSGIGLNIRSGPGLNYNIIDGAEDGVTLDVRGVPVIADGYRWQRVIPSGWVATDYLAGRSVNVSFNGNCYQQVSFPIDNCAGGSADPVAPIIKPISFGSGPYVVAIPGTNPVDLAQVQRVVRGAYIDRAREGRFINAGGYSSFEAANSLTYLLRNSNLDARVIYGR